METNVFVYNQGLNIKGLLLEWFATEIHFAVSYFIFLPKLFSNKMSIHILGVIFWFMVVLVTFGLLDHLSSGHHHYVITCVNNGYFSNKIILQIIFRSIKQVQPRHFLSKCLFQASKVTGYIYNVYVLRVSILPLYLWLFG